MGFHSEPWKDEIFQYLTRPGSIYSLRGESKGCRAGVIRLAIDGMCLPAENVTGTTNSEMLEYSSSFCSTIHDWICNAFCQMNVMCAAELTQKLAKELLHFPAIHVQDTSNHPPC